jgi:hypothetical protein
MGQLEEDFLVVWRNTFGERQLGHQHFWERALSRRQFFGTAAAAGGIAATSALWPSLLVAAADGAFSPPNPILGGTSLPFQGLTGFYFPDAVKDPKENADPSLIRDFNGFIGLADLAGGTVVGTSNTWNADMRFMKGVYVGVDGQKHQGAFGFI